MKIKKTWIAAVCAVLILAVSVVGTIAYLTASTEAVQNTFVVGALFDPDDDDPEDPNDPNPDDGPFVLYEHEAIDEDDKGVTDGVYELGEDEVTENEYTVLPGVAIPKDPFVRTEDVLELDAYVFVEVVDETSDALTVAVDDATWTQLSGVTGPNGGDVYYLTANDGKIAAGSKLAATYILENNEVTVAGDETITDPGSVDFYGYLIQAAGFTDVSDAWTKGFGTDDE